MKKILIVFGTRPEAIKMCPLVLELKRRSELEIKVCLTGQHEFMLKQIMGCFQVNADYNLHIMKENQSLSDITSATLCGLKEVLEKEYPDLVLVHGDTTTSFAAALQSFYFKIPVGHVEAGLRTGNKYSPYPEEMNRLMTDRIATYHFAPTELNKENLIKEGINDNIFVTGNTVIDSFSTTIKNNYIFHENKLNFIDYKKYKVILMTAHRRENWGTALSEICKAVKGIIAMHEDVWVIYPVHLNPNVRETVFTHLENVDRLSLINPVDVFDMHNLLNKCYMVMTDSGGLQEEAPFLGKPILVLRTETERSEVITSGAAKLVGVNKNTIVQAALELINNKKAYLKMQNSDSPYGDGNASKRIANILSKNLF